MPYAAIDSTADLPFAILPGAAEPRNFHETGNAREVAPPLLFRIFTLTLRPPSSVPAADANVILPTPVEIVYVLNVGRLCEKSSVIVPEVSDSACRPVPGTCSQDRLP